MDCANKDDEWRIYMNNSIYINTDADDGFYYTDDGGGMEVERENE